MVCFYFFQGEKWHWSSLMITMCLVWPPILTAIGQRNETFMWSKRFLEKTFVGHRFGSCFYDISVFFEGDLTECDDSEEFGRVLKKIRTEWFFFLSLTTPWNRINYQRNNTFSFLFENEFGCLFALSSKTDLKLNVANSSSATANQTKKKKELIK